MDNRLRLLNVWPFRAKTIHKFLVVALALALVVVSASVAPVVSAPKTLKITLAYTTAETTTSATVVWNTNAASDSLLQYSTTNPVPASAPTLYSPSQVTYHDFALEGLTPGTLYFYKVRSCDKRRCVTATGSFDTYPSCPDVVPPVSGNWQRVFSPNVSGTTAVTNQLLGVDLVSENDVWAVGWAQDPKGPPYFKRTLIEHFDGTAWSIVPSSNPPNDYHTELHAVSGASANDVWAVGSSHNGNFPSRTLIQHWDGIEWRIVPSPNPHDQGNELRGVAALSANDVWAVGYSFGTLSESNIDTLILHWDGVSWSHVASPNVLGVANQLFGITAISTNDIWAVGAAGGNAISMHWNGSAWSAVPLPQDTGLSSEVLAAVSGSAGNDVWAVGRGRGFFSNRTSGTIRHWDGTRWTLKICRAASSSNPPDDYEGGGPDSYFTGVSSAASNDVWAVGVVGSGPIILHWDGQAWTSVTHPRAFPNSAVLQGVATSSRGSAWSVGVDIEIDVSVSPATSYERTLIHRYTP